MGAGILNLNPAPIENHHELVILWGFKKKIMWRRVFASDVGKSFPHPHPPLVMGILEKQIYLWNVILIK